MVRGQLHWPGAEGSAEDYGQELDQAQFVSFADSQEHQKSHLWVQAQFLQQAEQAFQTKTES